MSKLSCILLIIFGVLKVSAVSPAICRAEFRWDDCGKPAKPVMYYWKQGSRCEIGFWKGCLPNPNMFADEYECINTCVFVDRPPPTETEAPDIITTTNTDNISSIVTDDISGIVTDSTPDNHDNVSTADMTNGSTADASTEKNENELSTLVPSPSSSETNNNGSEPANATKSDEGETNETTSSEMPPP